MTGSQIDTLCQDWLRAEYGEAIASDYTSLALVVPAFNPPALSNALEQLKLKLSVVFGPEESFGSVDYHAARERLGLDGDRTPVPDVYVTAFAGS